MPVVPVLVGLTVPAARNVCVDIHIVPISRTPDGPGLAAQTWPGRWVVTAQDPEPGVEVEPGDTVIIEFIEDGPANSDVFVTWGVAKRRPLAEPDRHLTAVGTSEQRRNGSVRFGHDRRAGRSVLKTRPIRLRCLGVVTLLAIALTGCAQDNQSTLNDMLSARLTKLGKTFVKQVDSLGPKGAADEVTSVPAVLQATLWGNDDHFFSTPTSTAIYSIEASDATASLNAIMYQALDVKDGWTLKQLRSYVCVNFATSRDSQLKVSDAPCPADIGPTSEYHIHKVRYEDLVRR